MQTQPHTFIYAKIPLKTQNWKPQYVIKRGKALIWHCEQRTSKNATDFLLCWPSAVGHGPGFRLTCMPSETSGESEFFVREQLSIGDSLGQRCGLTSTSPHTGTPSGPDLCKPCAHSSLKRCLQLCSQKKLCEGSEHTSEVSIQGCRPSCGQFSLKAYFSVLKLRLFVCIPQQSCVFYC